MRSKVKNNKPVSKAVKPFNHDSGNDALLVSVLESLPVGVIIYTLKSILYANSSAFTYLNFNKSVKKNLSSLSVFDFLLPEFHEKVKENYNLLLEGKKPNRLIFKLKNSKQDIFNIEVKSVPVVFKGEKALQATFIEVSDQINKINELDKTKRILDSIGSNFKDVIYEYALVPQPRISYISNSSLEVLGVSSNDVYKDSNSILDNLHQKPTKGFKETNLNYFLSRVRRTKASKAVFYLLKNEKLCFIEVTATPKFEGRKLVSIIGVMKDITQEINQQSELEQKWINYKNLLDSSPIGIFIHEGICIYSNKTAAKILEVNDPKKLVGKDLIGFLLPEERERAKIRMQKALQGEEQNDAQYQAKTIKGKIIDIELKTVPFIYNGKPCVQTTITNLSSEKALSREKLRAEIAEEANKTLTREIKFRQKIQHELMTQTLKYEAIFNSTSLLIWTIDKSLRITSFNHNYYNYIKSNFGHSLLIGQHITEIKTRPQSIVQLDIWIKKYKEFFKNKKDNKAEFFEIKNSNRQGETSYREIYLHPIRNAEGKIVEIAVIGQDTTERRLSEQKVLEQSAKLQAIFESGKQLIWTVDRNYFFTSFNQNFSDAMFSLYKVKPTLENKVYRPQKTKAGIEYHLWWLKKYDEVFKSGNGIEFTTEQLDSNKKKVFRQIFLHPIIRNGKVVEVSCISNDVTELRHLQNESINQAAKLTSIFESSSHLIWTIDKDYKVTSFNKNFEKSFKLYNRAVPVLNTQLHTLIPKRQQAEYKSYWYSIYKKVFQGNSLKLERQQKEPDGSINYKEIYLNPVRNANKEIIEIACLAHDITENKRFEQRIIDQSAKLKAIFESGDHLIWTVNKNLELTSYNKNYYSLVRNNLIKRKAEGKKTISVIDTIQDKEKRKFWVSKYRLVLKGKPHVFVHKSVINKISVYREIYLYPIFLNGNVEEVSVIAQNITERIENENKILEQSAKLKAIFESGDQLMWTITKDMKLTSFNQNYANSIYDFYGYYPELGKSMRSNKTTEYHDIWDEKYEQAFKGKQVEFISERTKRDGTKIIRQILLYPIKDVNNKVVEISGIGFDITENKRNEEKITQSLKEKDILLKEVHHRVKNNMQVISSILNLQSSYVKDSYALNLLKECQNRIKSMAFIHESLYQTKNFESVNFSEYVTTLSKNLVHTYSIHSKKIKLILTLDNLFLSLDASIPCGLIINEIVSNSLKYAFPDNRDGIIFVTLRVVKNQVKIEVGDNGIGIPESVDIKNTQTLGLQLVDTLVEQLNGTLILKRNKGTTFCIDFKI
jgi:PAS domain S-box-containing protein